MLSRPGSCGQARFGARSGSSRVRIRAGLAPLLLALFLGSGAARAEDPFFVQKIESRGRTVTAELADFDGDGRQDLLQVVTFGMPPDERRSLRLYRQGPAGVPDRPTLEIPLPTSSAAYDIGDVDGVRGADLLLLRPRGIGIVSFRQGVDGQLEAEVRDATIPQDLTIGVESDERGLDRLPMWTDAFGGAVPWLIAPGMGETFFMTADGHLQARVASGARANFFLQPPGLMLSESDIQIFLDAPRISVGDIDGDGRTDILSSSRHQLQIFLQGEDGRFDRSPSQSLPLGRITFEDHIRGSGAVRCAAEDIDGDGLADLIVSETLGGVMDAGYNTFIHFNRGSGWDLDKADYAFESPEVLGADQLIDVDGNGSLELIRIGIPINVLELIEIFLQETIDPKLHAYGLPRPDKVPATPQRPEPWFEVKLAVPLDFDTSRPAGFVPSFQHDFNGDGFLDYITSTDGSRLEVYVGSRKRGYKDRSARQKIETEGQIRPGDVNGDGLPDLVMFNTRRDNQPLRLLTNTASLPGTVVKPSLSPQPD